MRARIEAWLALASFAVAPRPSLAQENGFFESPRILLGVSTALGEQSPRTSPDGLELYFQRWGSSTASSADLWVATRNGLEQDFTNPVPVPEPVSLPGYGEFEAFVSADGLELYFHSDRPGGSGSYDIWVARRETPGGHFTTVTNVSALNSPYIDSSAAVRADGLEVFFASDRPGTLGGMDLFVARRSSVEEEFGEAQHMDAPISTSAWEWAPFLSSDSTTLVFGLGNETSDLWMAVRGGPDAPFAPPVRLGLPVNSAGWESGGSLSSDWPAMGSRICFGSDRGGGPGGDDIWEAKWVPGWAVPEPSLLVDGPDASCAVTVDASASTSPEGTTPLRYRWDFGDGTTGEWSSASEEWRTATHTYAAPGRFVITLTVVNALGVESAVTEIVTIPCSCAPGGDVAPWTAADVGAPIFPGSSSRDGDDLSVCAGGRGFGGSADELHFLHQAFTGDFVLTVRVSDVLAWGASGGSVGLMARDGLEPGARYAAVLVERASTVTRHRFRYREEPDASGRGRAGTTIPDPVVPRWLRLERCGDLFVARSSADGSAWDEVDRQVIPGMPETLLVGVAATGRDSGDPARAFTPLQARLSNLRVAPAAAGFVRGEANRDGSVDLSDAVAILGYLFLGGSLECQDAGDVDDDGAVVITDAIALLNFLFLGGPAPAAPYPDPGADPTEDELECRAAAPCD